MFDEVDNHLSFSDKEHAVLDFWRSQNIFQKSLDMRESSEEYVFYDGPPFATGLPHYGHLLAGTIKDVIPRYQTMCGKYCDRTFGWDCHGLPVENEVEKSLEINSKHEIEEFGVAKFNEACRDIVLKYTNEWESIVERMGRWVDFENGYKTMDKGYMESIWWVFKQLWDKGLIYEGHKIMWYCPRCATPLSNFEVNQGYVDVEDPAITVRFKECEEENVFFLAWTTTPWTLSSNMALAVGEDIDYVEIEDEGTRYVLAEALVSKYYPKEQPPIIKRMKGADLVGRTYEPIFDYFEDLRADGAFRVIAADFVSTTDGTGIVHVAPGFGEDDAEAGKANGVPAVCPIDDEGNYTADIRDYTGRFVKDCDKEIIQGLKRNGKLVYRSTYKHSYPHCWRCDSPLLNKAISTWFVNVESIKDKMLAANETIRWVPDHLKAGRFGKWLEGARDWAISRNRYWGCPLPIWRDKESGEAICVGSVKELEELSGRKVEDIHKHFVDDIVLTKNGVSLVRVPEVLDCWFESGSMPYAQKHFPFENEQWLKEHFPAEFIAEGLDQTRGWFYTLVVLGSALFEKPPFENVIVNGMILTNDGRKMSKRLKNYPDPMYIMDTYGADAMRLYMLSSPAVRAEDLRFSEQRETITDETGKQIQTPEGVRETMRDVLIPFWNVYAGFFLTYARIDNWRPEDKADSLPGTLNNPLDKWIISRLEGMVRDVRDSMDRYELQPAATRFVAFIDQLTNWYVRRSRRRFWKSQNDGDKNEAYATLYHALLTFCKTAAPFIPFITETVYRNLRNDHMPQSVHLCDYPEAATDFMDEALDRKMDRIITAVALGRRLRAQAAIRNRQPLSEVILVSADDTARNDLESMAEVICEELNVKNVVISDNESELVHLSAKANFPKLGPKYGPKMKIVAAAISALSHDEIDKLQRGDIVGLILEDGDPIELSLDDVDIRRQEKEGLAVANQGDVTVALDLQVSDELELEGLARELVHAVQETRKKLDFSVSDRISLSVFAQSTTGEAARVHADYIKGETLATEFEVKPFEPGEGSINICGHECRVEVAKV